MIRIIIVGYYENDHDTTYIKCLLESFYFDVYVIPLYEYIFDHHKKKVDYKNHMMEILQKIQPDIFLWFFFEIDKEFIEKTKNEFPSSLFVLYNRDDPYYNIPTNLSKKQLYDIILTTDYQTKEPDTYFLYPGVNPQIKTMSSTLEYDTDVSIFYSNCSDVLMNDEINAFKNSIIEHCKQNQYSVHLYGPNILKPMHSSIYKGSPRYAEKTHIYNKSRINIVITNKQIPMDAVNIVCSGNFLMINSQCELENVIPNKCYIYLKNTMQITNILQNYNVTDSYKKQCQIVKDKLRWETWVEKFVVILSDKLFSPVTYRELYDLEMDDHKALKSYWLNYGIKKHHVFFDFQIPANFNNVLYADIIKKPTKSKKYLYYHWYIFSKDKRFLTKNTAYANDLKTETIMNTTTEQTIRINSQLSKIASSHSTSKGLNKLMDMLKLNPNIEINDAIAQYVKVCCNG